jgi:hypothetical protein
VRKNKPEFLHRVLNYEPPNTFNRKVRGGIQRKERSNKKHKGKNPCVLCATFASAAVLLSSLQF